MTNPASRRTRLAVQLLEDRTVPAFNLIIDGDVAANLNIAVDTTTQPGTSIFTPTASGAVLDVDAIEAALMGGQDVLVTTGAGGAEAGNINYASDSLADRLNNVGFAPRTLTFRPDASATSGAVAVTGVEFRLFDQVDLVIDTTAPVPDGGINLTDVTIDAARSLTLTAGSGRVDVRGTLAAQSGDVAVTAGTFAPGGGAGATLTSDQGTVTIDSTVSLAGNTLNARADGGALTFNEPVDGPGTLNVYGTTVAFNDPVGEIFPVTTLTLAGGAVTYGPNGVSATTLRVGDGAADPLEATFGAGTGTVAGTLLVLPDGNLAPGGAGAVGTLTLVGNLAFQGGDYAVDLGTTSDLVAVTGNVTITAGRLGDEQSTGALSGPTDVAVIAFDGSLTGEFTNAPLGSGLYLGADAVRVTNYGPDTTGVTIARLPAALNGTATGFEPDGTQYTVKLTGGGELVTFRDLTAPPNRQLNVFARNTTIVSKIALTAKANASDTNVDLGPVRVTGPLGAFTAATATLNAPFVADGTVKALVFGRVYEAVTLGGAIADKTTFKAETSTGNITTPGVLSAVTVTGNLGGILSANAIGTVKVGGQLDGSGPGWTIPFGVKSITAGRIESFTLTASFLGTLAAIGNKHLSGDVSNSVIRLTSNDQTAAKVGLKALTARGNVQNTRITVEDGNVGSVTVGRFIDSQLYVDYTPAGSFNTGGTFDSPGRYRIGTFTTTAVPLGDPTSALNYSFAGSQVAADTLGTVRLSGLETGNGGSAFGFKFRTAGGSVRTKAADSPGIIPNVNLNPSNSPQTQPGDFYYIDV